MNGRKNIFNKKTAAAKPNCVHVREMMKSKSRKNEHSVSWAEHKMHKPVVSRIMYYDTYDIIKSEGNWV